MYDKNPNTILSSEVDLNSLDKEELKTAIQQMENQLKTTVLQHIDYYKNSTPELVSPSGQNLKPIPLRNPNMGGGIFGPPRIEDDPYYDIRPNVGGGDLFPPGMPGNQMGPEHPFFQRNMQRHFRGDPAFPNIPGPGGLGGLGGSGRFGPMG